MAKNFISNPPQSSKPKSIIKPNASPMNDYNDYKPIVA